MEEKLQSSGEPLYAYYLAPKDGREICFDLKDMEVCIYVKDDGVSYDEYLKNIKDQEAEEKGKPGVFNKEDYLKNPNTCPFCNKGNISGGAYNSEEYGSVLQNLKCEDCGKKWEDHYKLVDITEIP